MLADRDQLGQAHTHPRIAVHVSLELRAVWSALAEADLSGTEGASVRALHEWVGAMPSMPVSSWKPQGVRLAGTLRQPGT
jgi:hypothetical protein